MSTLQDIVYTFETSSSEYSVPEISLVDGIVYVSGTKLRSEMTEMDLTAEMEWYATIDVRLSTSGFDRATQAQIKRFIGIKLFEVECRIRGFPALNVMTPEQVRETNVWVHTHLREIMTQNDVSPATRDVIFDLYVFFLSSRNLEVT